MPRALPPLPYPDAEELVDHWWWRPGWRIGTRFYAWHVTVADLDPLAGHVAAYQEALVQFGFLDLIPRRWLHLTVQGLDHVHAVSARERDAVVDAVRQRLAVIPAPVLTFGRTVLGREAVAVPPVDPQPLRVVHAAVRAGIEAIRGPAAGAPSEQYRPHVSAAYVNAAAGPDPVRAALDAVAADPVQITLTHATLIEMHRDHRRYEWTTIATADLGPSQQRRP